MEGIRTAVVRSRTTESVETEQVARRDRLVYDLYRLSEEEIEIVEEGTVTGVRRGISAPSARSNRTCGITAYGSRRPGPGRAER